MIDCCGTLCQVRKRQKKTLSAQCPTKPRPEGWLYMELPLELPLELPRPAGEANVIGEGALCATTI